MESNIRRASGASVRSNESYHQTGQASLDSITTRLLTETKQLFDSFNGWAFGRLSEQDVSDNFVRLGNQFNLCLAMFERAGIDMSTLVGIPDQLRAVLEQALAHDQDRKTLELFMPRIRGVIIHLLQEIKNKQQIYRDYVAKIARQAEAGQSGDASTNVTEAQQRRPSAPGSPRKMSLVDSRASTSTAQDQTSSQTTMPAPERPQRNNRLPSDSIDGASTPARRRTVPIPPMPVMPEQLSERLAQESPDVGTPVSMGSPTRPQSRLDDTQEREKSVGGPSKPVSLPPKSSSRGSMSSKDAIPTPAPALSLPPNPSNPASVDAKAVKPSESEARLPPSLSKFGLERRASKRYSAYTMKRIEGIASPSSRSRLLSITAEDNENMPANGFDRDHDGSPGRSSSSPKPVSTMTRSRAGSHASSHVIINGEVMTIFLRHSGQTKKVQAAVDSLSMASLRMLFIATFSYNPGPGPFPPLYIRDRTSGVDHELEDIGDVSSNMIISLPDHDESTLNQKTAAQVEELSRLVKEDLIPRFDQLALKSGPNGYLSATDLSRRPSNSGAGTPGDRPLDSSRSLTPLPDRAASSKAGDLRDLRHEIGIMRQMVKKDVGDAQKEVASFRNEIAALKALSKEDSGGMRREIALGQEDLDRKSGVVVVMSTELQDQIEDIRNDVVERGIVPKPNVLSNVEKKLVTLDGELQWIENFVQDKNEAWRQQWTLDVEVILKQQDFLEHIQGLLKDLRDDYVILDGVMKGIKAHAATRKPAGASAGGSGPSRAQLRRREAEAPTSTPRETVLNEVRALQVDPEKRVQAIAEAERKRQQAKAAQRQEGNEFERELGNFVGGAKLKMAGGHEEVDRERARKEEATRKASFAAVS